MLPACAARSRINLAAHLSGVEVRRLLAGETDKPNRARRRNFRISRATSISTATAEALSSAPGVVEDRVVMCADNDDLIRFGSAGQLGHDVGHFLTADLIRLPVGA